MPRRPRVKLRVRSDLPPEVANVLAVNRRKKGQGWTEGHARVIAEFVGYTPTSDYPMDVDSQWPGRCHAHGHECAPALSTLLLGGGPCATCGHMEVIRIQQRVAEERLRADCEERGLTFIAYDTALNVTVKYPCGHTVAGVFASNIRHDQGCGVCAGLVVQPGINDLASQYPEVADELWVPWEATRIFYGYQKRVAWCCRDCGWVWRTAVGHRTQRESGCAACKNMFVIPGRNDLATTHPTLALQVSPPFDPTRIMAGSAHTRVTWRCDDCSFVWLSTPDNRVSHESACPECADSGFKRTLPTWLYFLFGDSKRSGIPLLKVGVSNDGKSFRERRKMHRMVGLINHLHDPILFRTGGEALQVESMWVDFVKTLPARLRLTKQDAPHLDETVRDDPAIRAWILEVLLPAATERRDQTSTVQHRSTTH